MLSLLQPAADKIVPIGTCFPFAADVTVALVLWALYTLVFIPALATAFLIHQAIVSVDTGL